MLKWFMYKEPGSERLGSKELWKSSPESAAKSPSLKDHKSLISLLFFPTKNPNAFGKGVF